MYQRVRTVLEPVEGFGTELSRREIRNARLAGILLLRFVCLFASLTCFSTSVWGLDPDKTLVQYNLRNWQVEDGLPQNSVNAIAQTPDGYLWIGTRSGLARFDGSRFEIFDRSNTPALKSHYIMDLAVDQLGALWIAINGGGLARYQDGEWQSWSSAEGSLPEDRILCLAVAPSGALWLGTYESGLGRYDGEEFTFLTTADGLGSNSVWALGADRRGDLWVGSWGGGLQLYKDGNFTSFELSTRGIWKFALDHKELWIGTNQGLVRKHEEETLYLSTESGLPNDIVRALAFDRDGNFWIGTHGGGLVRRRPDGSLDAMELAEGLASNEVMSLFEDREGHLWVGTLGGGLHRLSDGDLVPFGPPEGLSGAQVYSVTEADGHLWFGTFQEGVFKLDDEGFHQVQGLSSQNIFSVLGSRRGGLWIGTATSGLNRLKDGEVSILTSAEGLTDDAVLALYEGRDDMLWIGTNGGLSRLSADGQIDRWTTDDGLPSDLIRALWESPAGEVWIGTVKGLSRFSPGQLSPGEFENFDVVDGLSSPIIWSIHKDRDTDVLWLGTASGLNRFENGRISSLRSIKGLPDDDIVGLIEDDHGFLWLATPRGLHRLKKSELEEAIAGLRAGVTSFTYSEIDGMRDAEGIGGTQPSALNDSHGRLWFPTHHGVAMVDPAQIVPAGPGPHSRMERMVVNGEERTLSEEESLVLPPGSNRLEFPFSAIDLESPHRLRFRFRLVGFDEDWVLAKPGQRTVSYTLLRPGDYSFQVAARREDGLWNRSPTTVNFRLDPRFYQTTFFYLLCALLALAAGVILPQWRIRRLRERERELASRIDEALDQIKVLRGMIPICSSCKRIRDDTGFWEQLETYLAEHSEAEFSHGLCPKCVADLYGEHLVS